MIKLTNLSFFILFFTFYHTIALGQNAKEIEKESFKNYKSKNIAWANKQNPEDVEVLYINDYDESNFPNSEILKYKNLKKLIVTARSLVEKFNGEIKDPVKITINESELHHLKKLEFLQLSKFDFRIFPEEILELENLEILSLNNCLVETIPEEITKLKKLKGLFLRQNMLVDITSDINHLSQLKIIDLGNNLFTEIPKCLLDMNALEILYLANYNGVKSNPYTWDWPVNLSVNVIDYSLQGIILTELLSLPNLKEIHLHVNNTAMKKKVKTKLDNKTLSKKITWQSIDCGCG